MWKCALFIRGDCVKDVDSGQEDVGNVSGNQHVANKDEEFVESLVKPVIVSNPLLGEVILEKPEESYFHVMRAETRVKVPEMPLVDPLERHTHHPETHHYNRRTQ